MDSLRQILRVGYLYANGLKQNEIANQLGMSPPRVSRLLQQSRDYMRISYSLPRELQLESMLIRAFDLIEARVVETVSQEMQNQILGQTAAHFFDEFVENDSSVALSCGETLLEMIEALPRHRDRCLRIIQLSLESDPKNIFVSPAILAGVLRFKSSTDSRIVGFHIAPPRISSAEEQLRQDISCSKEFRELRDEAKNANFIFLGIGNPSPGGSISQRLLRTIGAINPAEFEAFIKQKKIVAEVNNQLLDNDGRDRTPEIPNISNRVITVLSLDELKAISSHVSSESNLFSKRQLVIGVAAGEDKATAIHGVLKSRIINGIITSKETAEDILRLDQQGGNRSAPEW